MFDLSVLRVWEMLFWTISALLREGSPQGSPCIHTGSGEDKYTLLISLMAVARVQDSGSKKNSTESSCLIALPQPQTMSTGMMNPQL